MVLTTIIRQKNLGVVSVEIECDVCGKPVWLSGIRNDDGTVDAVCSKCGATYIFSIS